MACFANMVKGTFNVKETNGEDLLVVVGIGDVMLEVEDSINCRSMSFLSHLFVLEEVCCFGEVGELCSNNLL